MNSFFARSIPLPDNPAHDASRQYGGVFNSQTRLPGYFQGTIKETYLDTHTYDVGLENGNMLSGVGRLLQDPGNKRLLPIGTRVALTEAFGPALILGVLPFTNAAENNENRVNLTGQSLTGGSDPTYAGKGNANFRPPNTPRDLGPDDWAQVGPDGNALAVLEGGVNTMKSGMAQVRTHLLNDLVEVICRNYRHISDMGISEIKNDNGQISWTFRGGADQLHETGADQENWTIRIDLGATGDLFRFELTQPNGTALFRLHVNNDGKVELFGAKGVDIMSGEQHTEKHLRDRHTVVKQADTLLVHEDQTQTIYGNKTSRVSNSLTETVGNDRILSTMRHEIRSVGGKLEESIVGGTPAAALPGDIARQTTINNGSWQVQIGNPLSGASAAALPGFDLQTFTGDISLVAKTLGDVTLKTLVGLANLDGTTVHLGPLAASPANPVVKGAVYLNALSAYTTTSASALSSMLAGNSTLASSLGPLPVVGTLLTPWVTALTAGMTALLNAHSALAAALPTTLSTKVFTA